MDNKQQFPVFFKKKDVFFILIALLLAAIAWFFFSKPAAPQGSLAIVSIGYGESKKEMIIPLHENHVYQIDAALPVHLEVVDESIRFTNSVCPDHRCEGFGWLRHEGDWAACVPAGVSVQIQEH